MSTSVNRVAIVTGGAQGIGRGIAKFLLGHTAQSASSGSYAVEAPSPTWGVVVVDTDEKGLEDAKSVLHQEQKRLSESDEKRVAYLHGDCASEDVARSALQLALSSFGRVDLLINNAGGGLPKIPLREQRLEEFYDILHRNVGTAYVFSKIVGSHWEDESKKSGQAAAPRNIAKAIVNISSTRALQSEANSEPYAAGKGGVVALTHALSTSLSHVARVNGINLGWIDVSGPAFGPDREQYQLSNEDITQHSCNKVGEADDVAHAVMFLYENYFMSGQCITLDGGMTKRMIYEE